jgi:hypothetical protein
MNMYHQPLCYPHLLVERLCSDKEEEEDDELQRGSEPMTPYWLLSDRLCRIGTGPATHVRLLALTARADKSSLDSDKTSATESSPFLGAAGLAAWFVP